MKMLISWIIILFNFFFCSDLEIEILVVNKKNKIKRRKYTCFKTICDLLVNGGYICDIDIL